MELQEKLRKKEEKRRNLLQMKLSQTPNKMISSTPGKSPMGTNYETLEPDDNSRVEWMN